ncbi:MAG: DUF4402 domain-containing protein [Proteobacteria bacterium]|nr:DUF4402 domain-containing protein [Pseudomonadota bacterium]
MAKYFFIILAIVFIGKFEISYAHYCDDDGSNGKGKGNSFNPNHTHDPYHSHGEAYGPEHSHGQEGLPPGHSHPPRHGQGNCDVELEVSEVQNLDFGALDAAEGGVIKTNCSTIGFVYSLGGCKDGKIKITGEKGKEVRVTLLNTNPYLNSGSASAPTEFSILESPPYILDNKGRFGELTLTIVGTLTVSNGQDPGNYNGYYSIDVDYD